MAVLQNKRVMWLDALRIMACLMVCLNHGPVMYVGTTVVTKTHVAYYALVTGANVFLMISGALLLPVTKPWCVFLKRRMAVVLWPLAIWTVIYLTDKALHNTLTAGDILTLLWRPANGILWYVYMTVVVYLTLPAASLLIERIGTRGVRIYLTMWLLSSLIPFQHGFLAGLQPPQHPLSFFYNCYGYVVLGHYLRHHPLPISTKHALWIVPAMLAGLVGMPYVEFYLQTEISWQEHLAAVYNNMSVNAVIIATIMFTAMQHIVPNTYGDNTTVRRVLTSISDATFGIYLMHMLVMERAVAPLLAQWATTTSSITAGVAAGAATFFLSLIVTNVLRQWRHSRYLVGR